MKNNYYGLDITLHDLNKGNYEVAISAEELLQRARALGGNVTEQDVQKFLREIEEIKQFNSASLRTVPRTDPDEDD